MRLRTLDIFLQERRVGRLFQYGEGPTAITRLIPDAAFWRDESAPVLSWAAATLPGEREAFVRAYATVPFFNGRGTVLPAFFQNMLPEGALRRHLAQVRGCAPDDHFELLATCGTDLPGAVYAYPAEVNVDATAEIVTQHHDAVEFSVIAEPLAQATSLSGIQPKLSLVARGGRYVARTKDENGTHIIAKLPTVEYALLPEVEELSLRLAAAVGVQTCKARLAPMASIDTEVPYALGESTTFLAVERFDREHGRQHVHCEDFAQILGIPPEMKYQHPDMSYGLMARVLMDMGRGDEAVSELVRRVAVNELLGNYDAHLKNFGVIYRDGNTAELSPAYDVVAYAAYIPGRGHALPFARKTPTHARLGPATVRAFCNECGFAETLAGTIIRSVVRQAVETWPGMIASSHILDSQKKKLLAHFENAPIAASALKRKKATGGGL
ncbi:MAG: type II toxin-antitoxin system HipA family toxin [Bdellovibrionales bacterium]|nr:type II toxin-antitoxin system HipA family toxin [Ramlibacter sp.]